MEPYLNPYQENSSVSEPPIERKVLTWMWMLLTFGLVKISMPVFDIRVFNPFARSNCLLSICSCYRQHEQEKRQQYNH